ncbi:class I SAM-dependent methyltransferase [Propionivibrio sp.]|uniref:class I SAM-dependent methyltransferase n=1 Tax=Propionivibrio sp. TaxID=2212460 RepID=UPI003BF3597D
MSVPAVQYPKAFSSKQGSGFFADVRTLWRLFLGQPRKGSHAQRLQAFYSPQAERYDSFRARLLHGRQDLIDRLAIAPGEYIVELGCGTGSSLDRISSQVCDLARIDLVDLCPALLEQARKRATGYQTVRVIEADATLWKPDQPVDGVFLSYALTMIPQWPEVLSSAYAMLKPGGRLGIVDFHLPASGNRFANAVWKAWFSHDGVHLSAEHLPRLQQMFAENFCSERRAHIPYLSGLCAPYYLFVGKKHSVQGDAE